MKKGILVFNKFYFDEGMQYMKSRLENEFSLLGVELKSVFSYAEFGFSNEELKGVDFAIFFDKDMPLARFFERNGIRVFNKSDTLCVCDDKELTYSCLFGLDSVKLADTIMAPLMYDVNDDDGMELINKVIKRFNFPIVVKEAVGSQGRQVYLAENKEDLGQLYQRLKHKKHIYQEFLGDEKGEDIRVYIIAKKPVGAVKRTNTTDFRSNVSVGGTMEIIELTPCIQKAAVAAAEKLGLEYGSVDFILDSKKGLIVIEANSNVYFKTCEALGLSIAKQFAEYIVTEIYG